MKIARRSGLLCRFEDRKDRKAPGTLKLLRAPGAFYWYSFVQYACRTEAEII